MTAELGAAPGLGSGLQPLRGPDDPRLASLPGVAIRDPEELRALSHDESTTPPCLPGAAVRPGSVAEIAEVMAWAHGHGVPVTPRGAGSGKAGGCVPMAGGLVLALDALDAIRCVRPHDGWAEVEPGVITGVFAATMEQEHRLFYPPDPASLDWCTLGGNVATNAGGPVALKYGVTGRQVLGLTLVLADGSVMETGGRQPKDVAGYDLTSLLVGSEGTLAVIAGVRLALLPVPREVRAAVLGFRSLGEATAALVAVRGAGVLPRAMELVDPVTLRRVRASAEPEEGQPFGAPAGVSALLLTEVDGPLGTSERQMEALLDAAAPAWVQVAEDRAARGELWASRREMSKRVKRGAAGWVTEDIAVPLGSMAQVVARLEEVGARHGLEIAAYGHAGDGNLHVNLLWSGPEQAGAVPAALDEVMALALSVGGTVTGEHGIGRSKLPWIERQLGGRSRALQRAIKAAWDPRGILNPGVGI